MPTPPKKPNLPFLDDDEKTQLEQPDESNDTGEHTREHAPIRVDQSTGLNDEDDEATVAVPPVKIGQPSPPRPNRPRR
jgi:hypothetical protein